MKRAVIYLTSLLFSTHIGSMMAQGLDPARAGLILDRTNKMKKTIDSQNGRYVFLDVEYEFLALKLENNTNFLREFNEYLNNFHETISIVAEFYGIYYELNQTAKNNKEFHEVISENPENSLAVAMSSNRNVVYKKIIILVVDIASDIRKVCLESSKMTEKERMQMFGKIRPKLREFNQLLRRLNLSIQYTNFATVLHGINFRYMHHDKTKRSIILDLCIDRWMSNARNVSK